MNDVGTETPPDRLGTYRTPNDSFFVRHRSPTEAPDPWTWALVVDGDVERPLRLDLRELKDFPSTSRTCVLECSGNWRTFFRPAPPGLPWGRGAVGNARWTGVRVRDLLAEAGLRGGAKHLHAIGADAATGGERPFLRSLELGKALDDAIVAFEMNGEPLPPLHGAPARLVVPGWAGQHWMKWLVRLSAAPGPAAGYYMDVDYRYPAAPVAPGGRADPAEMRPITELVVKSMITDVPARVRARETVTVRGFAFSGTPDVAGVELSDDGGATWASAELDPEHEPYAWRRWSARWTPRRPGGATLHVRATDGRGRVQPRDAAWNPGGYLYNGWGALGVDVEVGPPRPASAGPRSAPGSTDRIRG